MLEKLSFDRVVQLSQRQNYYGRLGLDSKVTPDQISNTYKNLIKVVHPDLNAGKGDSAKEATKKINEAYETLSDPERRAAYDSAQSSQQPQSNGHQRNRQTRTDPTEWTSWSPPRNRSFFENSTQQDRERIVALSQRNLAMHGIPHSRDGVLNWLSDSAKSRVGPRSLNMVLRAGLELELIQPSDVLRSEVIKTNIKAVLSDPKPGSELNSADGLRRTLKKHNLTEQGGFDAPEFVQARKSNALKHLAEIINGEVNSRISRGVGSIKLRFGHEKSKLIKSGDISPEDISQSADIKASLVKLSEVYEQRISTEGSVKLLQRATTELAKFLKQHGLQIPEEARQELEQAYAKKFLEWTSAHLSKKLGAQVEVKRMADIHQTASEFGLNIAKALADMDEFKELKKNHNPKRDTATNY